MRPVVDRVRHATPRRAIAGHVPGRLGRIQLPKALDVLHWHDGAELPTVPGENHAFAPMPHVEKQVRDPLTRGRHRDSPQPRPPGGRFREG